MGNLVIEYITEASWSDVARIYSSGITTRNATFEQQVPEWETWDKAHRPDCRLVAKINNKIVGWAALSNVSSRCVYSGVAEVSIYGATWQSRNAEVKALGLINPLCLLIHICFYICHFIYYS